MATTTLTLTVGSVALSGGGLIATSSSGAGTAASADFLRWPRSDRTKIYFEAKMNVRANANTSAGLCSTPSPAYSTTGAALYVTGAGLIYINGSSTGVNIGAFVSGTDVAGFALDLSIGQFFIRRNAGLWNNLASGNPALGKGGYQLSGATRFLAPYVQLGATSEQVTLNAGASAFAFTAPAGFTGWDTPGDPTTLINTAGMVEFFGSTTSDLRNSFIGVEVFRSVADAPPPPLGNGAALLIGL